jgi:hypothetical protein
MKNKKKLFSITSASAALILFLIIFSPLASASIGKDPHNITPLTSVSTGNTSTEQNPTHTYSAIGNYTVSLTANNENGTDSKLATMTVLEKNESITYNVVGVYYKCDSWSNEQYPLINLFEGNYVPLLANGDSLWQSHVNKLAKLVLDSNEKYTLKT